MLSEKNALISEERVRNLTDEQWIFHYAEIKHKKKFSAKEESNIINIILDRIENMLCNNAVFSRTDLKYDKVKEIIDKIKDKHEQNRAKRLGKSEPSNDVRESMLKSFNEVKDIAPVVLDVEEIDESMASVPRIKIPPRKGRKNGRR